MRKFFAFLMVVLIAVVAWVGYSHVLKAGPTQPTFVEFKTGSSARHE